MTAEGDQPPLLAPLAREHGEASREQPAVEVALELAPHELRQRGGGEPLLHCGIERLEVLAYDSVQGAELRPAALVDVLSAAAPRPGVDGTVRRTGDGRGGWNALGAGTPRAQPKPGPVPGSGYVGRWRTPPLAATWPPNCGSALCVGPATRSTPTTAELWRQPFHRGAGVAEPRCVVRRVALTTPSAARRARSGAAPTQDKQRTPNELKRARNSLSARSPAANRARRWRSGRNERRRGRRGRAWS